MRFSHIVCLPLALAFLTSGANAQDRGQPSKDGGAPADSLFRQWRTAFEQHAEDRSRGSMMGYGAEMSGMGMMSGGASMSGGMMGMAMPVPPAEIFQQAVRRAVEQLRAAETEEEKEKLLALVHSALKERYEQALAQRGEELDALEKRLEQLRTDLERRREAQKKVVEFQLRTVELAGEGLVDPGNSSPTRATSYGGMGESP